MSSPMDFSKFIDPNASTGTGAAAGDPHSGEHEVQQSASWSGGHQSSDESSPWLTPGTASADPFGTTQIADPVGSSIAPASSPVMWLYFSIGSAVLGALLAWLLGSTALTLVGWLFAGPVAIVLLGCFHKTDTFRRASGLYAEPSYLKTIYMTTIAVCLVAVIISAVFVGLWWGRA